MNVCFFSLKSAIDYFQIGGTESFVRRLAVRMVQEGIKVDYILYGNSKNKELNPVAGLTLKYFKTFEDAIDAINREYEHVITVYLLPKNRLKYALFRRRNNRSTIFHFFYFSWPDSLIRQKLYFSEARLFPYNGKLFCISRRQYEYVKKWTKNAVYILPPVSKDYFLRIEDKPINNKIKITFLGRIDLGKGIKEVIDIFKALNSSDRFECCIYGIHIPEDKQSLKIHDWLKEQKDIKYIAIDRQKYSLSVEDSVRRVLKETDIFIQPYQRLSSTIDTPLLLLEAMASLCVIITKPFGNILDIYGKSKFLIPEKDFISRAIDLLKHISYDEIIKERKRIYTENKRLNFKADDITKIFIEAING